MKFFTRIIVAFITLSLMPFQIFLKNDGDFNFNIEDVNTSSIITNASIYDTQVKSLFNSLSSGTINDLFIDNYYEGVYFSNLRENIGNNRYGSCSYVALGMLLSFYDSYWNDLFIPEEYDVEPTSVFTTYPSADFAFPSFYAESPGILFEPTDEVDSLSLDDYSLYISKNSNNYFQCQLLSLSQSYFGTAKFENEFTSFGMTFTDLSRFLGHYLYDYRNFNTSQVVISSCNDKTLVRSYAIEKIKKGIPVILRSESPSLGGHAFIAYDYDEANDEIYVHTGWRDEYSGKTLTHVSLSSTGFTMLSDAISLDILMPSSFSFNYHSTLGDNGTSRNFIFPQDIKILSGNYRDELPTFTWKSAYNEKWVEEYNPYFNFSILNSSSYQTFEVKRIKLNKITLSEAQWNNVLNNYTTSYYTYVELDSDIYPYWDDYYAKKSFEKPIEYNQLPQIKPNEYGFSDSYPSDETTKNSFVRHTASHNFNFETRRFRVGYIHDEYIVMSPIRDGFKEAFIEYRFDYAVTRIDVEIAHWRSSSYEQLTSSTGKASIQYYWENRWVDKFDLLSSASDIPTDRNSHAFFKIEFKNPVYRVRFHAQTFAANTNADNRGRICIGNMAFYPSEYNLPLSGGELDYNTSLWAGVPSKNNNCYAYALNNQTKPGTSDIWWKQQPGEYAGNMCKNYDKTNLVNAVLSDFAKYNSTFGTTLLFYEIGKHEKCPSGTYKVALVSFSGDYHWYRQDADGYWSHKPGTSPVRRSDTLGKIILDPELASRGNYTTFIGYFVVSPWGHMYE